MATRGLVMCLPATPCGRLLLTTGLVSQRVNAFRTSTALAAHQWIMSSALYVRYEEENFYLDPRTNQKRRFASLDQSPTLYLSVIVPAMNEEQRLPTMMDECMQYLNDRSEREPGFTYEVIIVDDGSTDDTIKVAQEYVRRATVERVRVLKLRHNRGKGGAVRLGMLSARGQLLLMADADGASRFSDLEKLERELLAIQSANADGDGSANQQQGAVAVGSRAHLEQESIAERSAFRTFLMYGFHFLVWLFAVRSIKDTQCGFKMFTRPAARLLFPNLHVERWAFDVELLFLAEKRGIPIREVAITWHEIEGSKLTPLAASIQMGRDLFLIWFWYFIGVWKMEHRPKIE